MKRLLLTLLIGMLSFSFLEAQVTYSEDIAPILYNNCTSCHREGEIGPFPLTNYDEAVNWSNMLKYVTEIKYMPPWKPERDYSNFIGERGLTEEQIQLIADWVDAGTPQGDPSLEPPLPDFPSGSQLGEPDLVLTMEEAHFIQGNNQDDYRVFVLPTGLLEDKEIAAVEFRAGNTRAVHHALLAYETNGAAAAMDAETPEYGYESFGDFGVMVQGTFNGYTPGIQTVVFPEGIGTTLPAGSDILIQVHYAPLPTDETDQSSLNIFFKDEDDSIVREIERRPISPFNLDGGWASFVIPPGEITSFHGTRAITEDISLISVYPHSHYLGKSWELYAETATGDTINIIKISDWDFNWQGSYTFDRMKKIPAGSTMHINATYDNTTANPFNPANPPQEARWGEGTTDEMYLVGTSWVPYQEGDENIVIGQGVTTSLEEEFNRSGSKLSLLFPNPTSGEFELSYYLENSQNIRVEMFDANGRLVKTLLDKTRKNPGKHSLTSDASGFPAGMYILRLSSPELILSLYY
ncbi:MAG: T9SS type A sorting domain-containing protein, partial [Bacteroidota bacterium]